MAESKGFLRPVQKKRSSVFKNKTFTKILEANLSRDLFIENWAGRNYLLDRIFSVRDHVTIVTYSSLVKHKSISWNSLITCLEKSFLEKIEIVCSCSASNGPCCRGCKIDSHYCVHVEKHWDTHFSRRNWKRKISTVESNW